MTPPSHPEIACRIETSRWRIKQEGSSMKTGARLLGKGRNTKRDTHVCSRNTKRVDSAPKSMCHTHAVGRDGCCRARDPNRHSTGFLWLCCELTLQHVHARVECGIYCEGAPNFKNDDGDNEDDGTFGTAFSPPRYKKKQTTKTQEETTLSRFP